MVFYLLYKYIKKSRAAKRQSHNIPLRPFDGQHDSDSLTQPNASALHEKSISHEAEAEKRRRRVYRLKLVCALFMPYFLATIDLTIVATAVPFIASHFSTSLVG